jgi:hypothetical protein
MVTPDLKCQYLPTRLTGPPRFMGFPGRTASRAAARATGLGRSTTPGLTMQPAGYSTYWQYTTAPASSVLTATNPEIKRDAASNMASFFITVILPSRDPEPTIYAQIFSDCEWMQHQGHIKIELDLGPTSACLHCSFRFLSIEADDRTTREALRSQSQRWAELDLGPSRHKFRARDMLILRIIQTRGTRVGASRHRFT